MTELHEIEFHKMKHQRDNLQNKVWILEEFIVSNGLVLPEHPEKSQW